MMSKINRITLFCFSLMSSWYMSACTTNGESAENLNSTPTLMVIPSDALMQRSGYLELISNQGENAYYRDYQGLLVNDANIKFVIAAIMEELNHEGFILEDMEQALKQLSNDHTMDVATDVKKDMRTILLNTLRPDYVIEIDYQWSTSSNSRNLSKSFNYALKCINSYSNKSVASISRSNIGESKGNEDIPELMKKSLSQSVSDFGNQISKHYQKIIDKGAEITLRIVTLNGTETALDDKCGEEYLNDRINNWLKDNTVDQSFRLSVNTSSEMKFTGLRIFSKDENGKKVTAYDFAQSLQRAISEGCNLKVRNRTQSIGISLLEIE
jgi:hypothetical protein